MLTAAPHLLEPLVAVQALRQRGVQCVMPGLESTDVAEPTSGATLSRDHDAFAGVLVLKRSG